MPHDKPHTTSTDDDVARRAAENPLRTAGKAGPKQAGGGLSWSGPAAAVAIALVILLIFVVVL